MTVILMLLLEVASVAVTVKGTYGTGYQRDLEGKGSYMVMVAGPGSLLPVSSSFALQLEYLVLLADRFPEISFSKAATSVSSLLNVSGYYYLGFRQPSKKTGRFFYPFVCGTFSGFFSNQRYYLPGIEVEVGMDLLFGDRFPKVDFSGRGCFSAISGERRPVVTVSLWCGFYFRSRERYINSGIKVSMGTLF